MKRALTVRVTREAKEQPSASIAAGRRDRQLGCGRQSRLDDSDPQLASEITLAEAVGKPSSVRCRVRSWRVDGVVSGRSSSRLTQPLSVVRNEQQPLSDRGRSR